MKDDDDDDEGFLDTPMKQKLLEVTPPSTTKLDRLGDRTKMSAIVMQEINAILRKFATDTIFQRHLARPAVQEGEHPLLPYPFICSFRHISLTHSTPIPLPVTKPLIIGKESKKMVIIDMKLKLILALQLSIHNYAS